MLTVFFNDLTDKKDRDSKKERSKKRRCLTDNLKTDGAMSFIAFININHVEFAALFILRVFI